MNTPPESVSPHSTPPSGTTGFFQWLRDLGITRSTEERWFTGVAGGIAQRAGIDPLIVRGIFVVLAILGGPGVLLYVAGWLLLPDASRRIHAEELVRGRATTSVIVVAILIGLWLLGSIIGGINFPGIRHGIWGIPGIPDWFGATFQTLFWIAVLAGVGFLLHRIFVRHGQGQQPRPDTQETPPAWELAEATEKFNTWSADYAHKHAQRQPGALHLLISAAFSLIAAGLAALWAYSAGTSAPNGILIAALAAGTAVFAISMIVAGLRGKSSGPNGVLAVLGALSLAVTAIAPTGTTYHLIGTNTLSNPTAASVSAVGETNVDLALYDSASAPDHVELTMIAGQLNLNPSSTRPTTVTMDVAAGSIDAPDFGGEFPGVMVRKTITVNESAPGEELTVHIRVLAGTITVTN